MSYTPYEHFIDAAIATALKASELSGNGDPSKIDAETSRVFRSLINRAPILGHVKISEGAKDKAKHIRSGTTLGAGGQEFDLALDVLDGTTQTSKIGSDALSAIAIGEKGSLWSTKDFYTMKLACGPDLSDVLSLHQTIQENIKAAAQKKNKDVKDVVVAIIDRPRHKQIIQDIRKTGAKAYLFTDCDISIALATCLYNDIDFLYGIGGSPESVVTAVAIKNLGGQFQCQVWHPPLSLDREPVVETRFLKSPILTLPELVKGQACFIAAGVTDGKVLKGVKTLQTGRKVVNTLLISPYTIVEANHTCPRPKHEA